jgi:site-specific recombinase XerD
MIFSQRLFNARLKIAVKHARIDKNVSAHAARHTCASRLINKDVPITTIQKVIGHRSLKMAMVYAQTNENTLVRQLSL